MAWCPRASSSVPHNEGSPLKVTVSVLFARLRRVADDGSRWRCPGLIHGFDAVNQNGAAASELAADAHACIMVRVARPTEYKVAAARAAFTAGSPRHRCPDHHAEMCAQIKNRCDATEPARAHQSAAVLGAVKVWPGNRGVCRTDGATANLDSPCARRRCELRSGRKKACGAVEPKK